jgi:hypothetical protein
MSAYSTNTRSELVALCKERGISGYSILKKEGLIALLEGEPRSSIPAKKRRLRIIPDDNTTDEVITSVAQLDITSRMPAPKKSVKKSAPVSGGAGGLTQWISTSEPVRLYEQKIDVLPVVDVEIVRLVLFEHDDKTYYRDPNKNKLFVRKGSKTIGSYIGRWDSQNECIVTDVPDSDAE